MDRSSQHNTNVTGLRRYDSTLFKELRFLNPREVFDESTAMATGAR